MKPMGSLIVEYVGDTDIVGFKWQKIRCCGAEVWENYGVKWQKIRCCGAEVWENCRII